MASMVPTLPKSPYGPAIPEPCTSHWNRVFELCTELSNVHDQWNECISELNTVALDTELADAELVRNARRLSRCSVALMDALMLEWDMGKHRQTDFHPGNHACQTEIHNQLKRLKGDDFKRVLQLCDIPITQSELDVTKLKEEQVTKMHKFIEDVKLMKKRESGVKRALQKAHKRAECAEEKMQSARSMIHQAVNAFKEKRMMKEQTEEDRPETPPLPLKKARLYGSDSQN